LATEWIVETRSGGKCVVRVVHSLFTTADDWDNQLESSEGGWPGFFDILRLYLTHFRGQPCSAFQLMAVAPEPDSSAWNVLTGSLGLTGAAVGERRATPASSPRLAAVVESAGDGEHPCSLLLRLEQPTSGIAHLFALAMGGQVYLSLRFYLYGDQAPAIVARDEPLWQAWLNTHFPAAADVRND
jgi:hypothetical protein